MSWNASRHLRILEENWEVVIILLRKYETITCRCDALSDDIIAYMKLRIIAEALNEGWSPKFVKDEKRYYPWFHVDYRGCNYASAYGGVSYASASYGASNASAYVGSRLVFKSREIAEYAKQFEDIWSNYIVR